MSDQSGHEQPVVRKTRRAPWLLPMSSSVTATGPRTSDSYNLGFSRSTVGSHARQLTGAICLFGAFWKWPQPFKMRLISTCSSPMARCCKACRPATQAIWQPPHSQPGPYFPDRFRAQSGPGHLCAAGQPRRLAGSRFVQAVAARRARAVGAGRKPWPSVCTTVPWAPCCCITCSCSCRRGSVPSVVLRFGVGLLVLELCLPGYAFQYWWPESPNFNNQIPPIAAAACYAFSACSWCRICKLRSAYLV